MKAFSVILSLFITLTISYAMAGTSLPADPNQGDFCDLNTQGKSGTKRYFESANSTLDKVLDGAMAGKRVLKNASFCEDKETVVLTYRVKQSDGKILDSRNTFKIFGIKDATDGGMGGILYVVWPRGTMIQNQVIGLQKELMEVLVENGSKLRINQIADSLIQNQVNLDRVY